MPKRFTEIIEGLGAKHIAGSLDAVVSDITSDSRKVERGSLFIARKGEATDGHKYIADALSAGASAVVCQYLVEGLKNPNDAPIYSVIEPRKIAGEMAARLLDRPCNKLVTMMVTGTNGKTTCTYLCAEIARAAGKKSGIIGTVGYHTASGMLPAPHTTPEGEIFQKLLFDMLQSGISVVSGEASSHALKQGRLAGSQFDAAGFTNISRDHLDFHSDIEDYYQAKKRLFTEFLKPGATSVINIDDEAGKRLCKEISAPKLTFSIKKTGAADIRPLKYNISISGIAASLLTPIGEIEIISPLVGGFNLMNILTSVGMGIAAGFKAEEVADGIARSEGAPGRLERVNDRMGAIYFVDYAHTPDALTRVTTELRRLSQNRLIVIFGCGGDRDKGKRPLMGLEAAKLADICLVTSDNPRTEKPEDIIDMIIPGVEEAGLKEISIDEAKTKKGYLKVVDRREAIKSSVKLAREGDIVLVAGKGHEDYQEINKIRYPFADRVEIEKALRDRDEGKTL